MQMKILLTGGAGFIGSHVAEAYLDEGYEVVIVDNLSTGNRRNLPAKATFYLLDIRSKAELEKVFALEKPDVVNHHAAQKAVPTSIEDPYLDADINVMGLINLLNNCIKYHTKKFIFISSGGALLGDVDVIPTDESAEPNMISPYAITKYISEKYLHFYALTYGLEYMVLRYANVYGPRQVPEGECGVIPIFFHNYFANKPSLLMAYSDQPRGTTRDYVYIDDVAQANLLALTKGKNEILNIGSGIEVHIEDIYLQIKEIFDHHLPLIRTKERTGDVKRSCLDCSKAKKVLGWEANISLKEGITKLRDAYFHHFHQKCGEKA
jgi:UDP-glucose 4-epimerase